MNHLNISLGSHRTDVSVFDYQYQWTISNFKFCCGKKTGDALNSPIFIIDGTHVQGRLMLYPNGINDKSNGYLSIYLELRGDGKSEVIAEFHVWIKKTNTIRSSKLENFSSTKVHGFANFVKQDAILKQQNEIMLVNGELTIVCDITVSTGAKNDCVQLYNLFASNKEDLSESLEEILRKKKFCDVTLSIDDQDFQAHRVILAVRSERFDRLFSQNPNKIYFKIKDIPAEIMENVLSYLYTGEVYVDALQVEHFLNVALSYQFMDQELKSKLEDEVLISQIDVSNAAELLVIAYDYNLDKLYNTIVEFVFDHRVEVIQSDGYKRVVESREDFFTKNGITLVFDGLDVLNE